MSLAWVPRETVRSISMIAPSGTTRLAGLQQLLAVSQRNYDACIAHVDHTHTCNGVAATMRLHHLRFDANGQPKVEALAKCLSEHITLYAVSSRNRPMLQTDQEWVKFIQDTRRLFRANALARGLPDLTGEAGEMLLYFLMEAVLQAPQVVAKVELKTNPRMEVNGSDGIHMRWDATADVVDIYFGEAKLHEKVSDAIASAFISIERFHAEGMREHEVAMVTRHFKGADPHIKDAVTEILDTGRVVQGARVNHACLIGYDWGTNAVQALHDVEAEYRRRYLADAPRLHGLLQRQLDTCSRKEFGFEVFFLPFPSVQAFRDAFKTAME